MRAFNALSSLAVMACVVVISFVHSLELFRTYGFTGYLAYLGVFAVEITFISSMFNIIVCRLKERPAGLPSYIGGLLGVSLVAWSNVSATVEYGVPGIVLGLFVPAALIVSESIMSYAVIRAARADTKRAAKEEERAERSASQPPVEVAERRDSQPVDRPTDQQTSQPTDQPTEADRSANIRQPANQPSKVDQPAKPTASQPTNKAADRPSKRVNSRSAAEVAERSTNQTSKETVSQTSKQSANQPAESPYELAVRYYREHGRLPSQRALAGMAGCTRYKASVVLNELKKKVVAM